MISNIDQRILFYDASQNTWTDHTIALNDNLSTDTAALSFEAGDYLYISSFLPFNHKYFKVTTPSNDGKTPVIEIASGGNEWSPMADQLDYTVNFSQSGVLQWTPDVDKSWGRISRNRVDLSQSMATAPIVYDAYWLRISFAEATQFTLGFIGQLFSSDSDLYAEYPVLQNTTYLSGWKAGKTDWRDQHILAAAYIAKYLIEKQLALSADQVLDIATFRSAATHKTAHIIYSGLGAKNYESEIKLTGQAFIDAMRIDKFQLDTTLNARKDVQERLVTSSRATR